MEEELEENETEALAEDDPAKRDEGKPCISFSKLKESSISAKCVGSFTNRDC